MEWRVLWRAVLALMCWCLAGSAGAYETVPPADVTVPVLDLGPLSQVFTDPSRTLTADGVLASMEKRQVQRGEEVTSVGITDAAVWFVIPVENRSGAPVTRVLALDPCWLDDVRVTVAGPGGRLTERRGGMAFDFSARAVPHRKLNLEVAFEPGRSTLLVRVQNRGPFAVALSLWERSAFVSANGGDSSVVPVIFSVLGSMLLFNLVLWLSVRDKVYAAYVIYLLSFMLVYASYNGYLFQYAWPSHPHFANWFNAAAIYLFAAAGIHFALHFLDLRERMPRLHRLGRAAIPLVLFTLLIASLANGFEWSDGGLLWVLGGSMFSLVVGLSSLATGNRSARYFVPATVSGFFGSLVSAMAASGYVPFNNYTFHAVDFGMAADAILLSIALADRLRLARAATEAARAELLEATRIHAQELEMTVEQRTRELRAANAAKDRLFSIIAHDLRGPLRSLGVLYSEVVRSPRDFNEELLALTRAATHSIGELLEQLLLWARSQRGEIAYAPDVIDLAELLRETQDLYHAEASTKGIDLRLTADAPCMVYADVAMAKTILRNLTGNALKFTPHGGRVWSSVEALGDRWLIRISDTGAGMGPEQQRVLFSVDDDRGNSSVNFYRGLGLLLCRDFVERHGGTISVESRPGAGATFSFTLPRAAADAGQKLATGA